METHSNILAWKIPWTEEPGGLQSMGSQRVGHSRARAYTHTQTYRKRNSGAYPAESSHFVGK